MSATDPKISDAARVLMDGLMHGLEVVIGKDATIVLMVEPPADVRKGAEVTLICANRPDRAAVARLLEAAREKLTTPDKAGMH